MMKFRILIDGKPHRIVEFGGVMELELIRLMRTGVRLDQITVEVLSYRGLNPHGNDPYGEPA